MAETLGGQGAVVARLVPALTRTIGLVHRANPLTPSARAFVELARPDQRSRRAGSGEALDRRGEEVVERLRDACRAVMSVRPASCQRQASSAPHPTTSTRSNHARSSTGP